MKRYGRYKVTLPGEQYEWEPDEVTLTEQLLIENETETTYHDWIRAIVSERAEAVQVLVWFLRRKAGQQCDRLSIDFEIRKLDIDLIAEPEVDDGDPEALAGSEPATSTPPSASTESGPGSSGDSPEVTSTT